MTSFQQIGNDLYTGKRSVDFVGRRRLWFLIAAVLIAISVVVPVAKGGLELGIEFTGGSEFHVSQPATADQALATADVARFSPTPARVAVLGDGAIRVQTDALDDAANAQLRESLAESYGVAIEQVNVSTIGPSWGADITRQMVIGLVVFVVLAGVLMALYFRTWKMSLAAIIALFHDLIVTVGVYAITGVEVTPAAVIGFLTILGYSLYDTVVVFDKIRENTALHSPEGSRTFAELVNLAINQTLVRSINTSVVALLPVAAILFIGAFLMGAGTLRDISLALFIGILVGALSTIFIAGPMYAQLRSGEPEIRRIDERVVTRRALGEVAAPGAAEESDEDDAESDSADDEPEPDDEDDDGEPAAAAGASAGRGRSNGRRRR